MPLPSPSGRDDLMASLDRADQDLAAGRARLLDDGLIASLPEDSTMTDIARRWTVFIDTFGRPFDVEGGISPHAGTAARDGTEAVVVAPVSDYEGAVERVEIVEGALLEACEAAWPRRGAEKAAEFTMREIDARKRGQ